jgi:hypothetical protein
MPKLNGPKKVLIIGASTVMGWRPGLILPFPAVPLQSGLFMKKMQPIPEPRPQGGIIRLRLRNLLTRKDYTQNPLMETLIL